MTLTIKVKVIHFRYVLKTMIYTYLLQIGSGLIESLMSYRANELKIAVNGVKNSQNDLEDESQGHPLSIGVDCNASYIFGAT